MTVDFIEGNTSGVAFCQLYSSLDMDFLLLIDFFVNFVSVIISKL